MILAPGKDSCLICLRVFTGGSCSHAVNSAYAASSPKPGHLPRRHLSRGKANPQQKSPRFNRHLLHLRTGFRLFNTTLIPPQVSYIHSACTLPDRTRIPGFPTPKCRQRNGTGRQLTWAVNLCYFSAMCGRYTIAKPARVVAVFEPRVIKSDVSRPRYNIAPMQQVPVITGTGRERVLQDCQWGLVPDWAREPAIGSRMINARSETAAIKPAFRTAFRQNRCLIPADGFYEWRKAPSGKQPFRICADDAEPFAIAGLYSSWSGNGSSPAISSCIILTREADAFMAKVHDRMPVILPYRLWDAWADTSPTTVEALQQILAEPFDRKLAMTRVSLLVNSPANDSERCIAPFKDDSLFPDDGE